MYIHNCRVKGPNHILGLGPWPRVWVVRGRMNGNEWFKPRTWWARYKWEGGLRRNISSDMIKTAQICIPTIKVTFQEALVIRTCIITYKDDGNSELSKGKLLPPHWMHYSYFSGRIYVEETPEQCYLCYHNSQKAKKGVWWDRYSSKGSNDQQV